MRSKRSRAWVIVATLILGLFPTSVAHAADTPTTTAVTSIDATIRIADPFTWTALVQPAGSPGSVWFYGSSDGIVWDGIGAASYDQGTGIATRSDTLSWTSPVGDRFVRAEFSGSVGFEDSVSTSVAQTVQRALTNVTNFTVNQPDNLSILPGTAPLTFRADTGLPDANIEFQRETSGGWETLGIGTPFQSGGWFAMGSLGALGTGSHHLRALFPGDATREPSSDDLTLVVDKGTSSPGINIAPETTIEIGEVLALSGNLSAESDGSTTPSGVLEIKVLEDDSVYFTSPADQGFATTISYPTPGTRTLALSYAGDDNYAANVSPAYVVHVAANTVHATGVGVAYSTFYPVKDGYRDTEKISGRRDETASVSIRIYSPGGKLILTKSLPSGIGAYTFTWNGRNSAGTILASGKYKVNQTLRDGAGLSKTWTSYATLSKKKLVTKTTYVTKKGSSVTAKGDFGSGSISISTSGGYAKLKATYPTGWVGVGYQLTLPKALYYKSISLQVYNKGYLSAPPNEMALQNFQTCPYNSAIDWDIGCFDRWNGVGSGAGAKYWDKTSAHLTRNRSGTRVRGIVSVNYGTVYIYSVRLKVVYQVLQ